MAAIHGPDRGHGSRAPDRPRRHQSLGMCPRARGNLRTRGHHIDGGAPGAESERSSYARTEASPLVRGYDFLVLPAGFLAAAATWGGLGLTLLVPGALVYLLIAAIGRVLIRTRRARQVDRAIDAEAWRTRDPIGKLT